MEIKKGYKGDCMTCMSNCCSLRAEISKKEYDVFVEMNLEKHITKESDEFIKKYPDYKDKQTFLDKTLYQDKFATINRETDGFCSLLDRKTRLCTIYENRPSVCLDFNNESNRCKEIRKCIN